MWEESFVWKLISEITNFALTSQYVLSLLMFVVQNKKLFLTNNENHVICSFLGNSPASEF